MKKRMKSTRTGVVGEQIDARVWQAAQALIGFAERHLTECTEMPTARQQRDVVLAALHRRAAVTTMSIANLLHIGQLESAIVLSRTLVEIELNTKLVTADPTDEMALRLVAFDYYTRQRYGQRMLHDPATRAVLERYPGHKEHTIGVARSWSKQFDGPFFDSVREKLERDLSAGRGWHGHQRVEDAFAAADSSPDYFQQYSLQSPYVHAGNPEWDFVEFDGRPIPRTLVASKPEEIVSSLGLALYRLYTVLLEIVADRLYPPPLADRAQREKRIAILRPAKVRLIEFAERLGRLFGTDPFEDTTAMARLNKHPASE